ncbi:long-chain-fatty-acid--CoA ligase [Natranaerofaba carboxydovora]|uniref:long-chain-fatty-acid--CoA ligase n=1 Tax=Natranaerofaba carboxydovora TaxID=2742683 RepID=UPI001F1473FD|nr:long-chain-fatty-acid--CoA ligase [Natranaerofaba carboxydovora]
MILISYSNENSVNFTNLSPLSFLNRSAAVFSSNTAIIYGQKRYTYHELNARVNRLARALNKFGVKKGDRVAFLSPNIPPLIEGYFGVPLSGGVLVSFNTGLDKKDVQYILNHSEPKVLFVDTEFAKIVEPIKDKLKSVEQFVLIHDEEYHTDLEGIDYEEFLSHGSEEPISPKISNENDTISINYTSGTTGLPKGAMYTHRGAYLHAMGEALVMKLSSDDNFLWTLPMFHCNGWGFVWAVTAVGATHVCLRSFKSDLVYDLIDKEKITRLCATPTMLILLSESPYASMLDIDRELWIMTAGASPSPHVIHKMEAMGANIIHTYGLTETYGPYCICEPQQHWDELSLMEQSRMKSRQGVPYIQAFETRVVDESMNDVPKDGKTLGEIVMRGNNVMKGYFRDEEKTKESFRGGWFHSGDLAVMHEDGYIEIKDRKKDIIVVGGENVSTIEVELAICKHPLVLDSAVIAKKHETWGEVPKAFVVPKPGTSPSENDISEFCEQKLPEFKCPYEIVFLDEIPKTSTGKIQKHILQEM